MVTDANTDLLATACRFLADGGEMEEAALLATCAVDVTYAVDNGATVTLFCPRVVFDLLDEASDGPDDFMYDAEGYDRRMRVRRAIGRSLRAVIPPPFTFQRIDIRARSYPDDAEWWDAFLGEIRARLASAPRELPAADS